METTTPAGYTPIADITGIVVGAAQQSYSFDRVNTKIVLGSITLNKSGLGATDIAGFTLYNSAGAAVGIEKRVIGNGSVTWSNLPWDTYTIRETTTPAGYTPIADITAIVVGAAQQSYSFNRANTKIVLGSITLNKTGLDATDTAGFTLYYSSGAAVVGGEKTVTGNGSVNWSNLPWDTYNIKETTTPPGYVPIADITGIVVGASQQSYSFDRVNTKIVLGSITLNKSGLGTGDTAGFTLYNSAGAAVGAEKTVTGNGTVSWTNLPWGTYKIKETTTPKGYTRIANITGIVVGAAKQSYSFSRTNTKKPPPPPPVIEVLGITELPFTGMNPIIPIAGILSMFAGVILLVISVSKRRRKEI
ncbi:hypothetical protein ES695_11895 [Candidatus Atribacteria bacterium 1244-E10-H5-B2]|nr:MAG: hypothetical protein ES695_11895 [Candidatus Atribacteria bacterium 1244-E10-H5-B2]